MNDKSLAGKFRRTSGPTYARPNDTWDHLAMGLCLPSGTSLPTTSSFYSNFASVSRSDHAFCSRLQPTNDDYKVNNPNGLNSKSGQNWTVQTHIYRLLRPMIIHFRLEIPRTSKRIDQKKNFFSLKILG